MAPLEGLGALEFEGFVEARTAPATRDSGTMQAMRISLVEVISMFDAGLGQGARVN